MIPGELNSSAWDTLLGFLTFRVMLSPDVLLACYYCGALVMPVVLFHAVRRVLRRTPTLAPFAALLSDLLGIDRQRRWLIALVLLAMFLAAELAWRMLFEFLLAYFQIRDALVAPR